MGKGISALEVGAALRALRRELGLTQEALGQRAEISPTNLSAYEKGRSDFYVSTLCKILAAMDVGFIDLDVSIRRLRGETAVSVEDWQRAVEILRDEVENLRQGLDELRGGGS